MVLNLKKKTKRIRTNIILHETKYQQACEANYGRW